jgi:hypothetical protein
MHYPRIPREAWTDRMKIAKANCKNYFSFRYGAMSEKELIDVAEERGVSSLADKKYFTLRADEYPGPGIIPSIGRSFYIGIGAKF